MAISGAMLFITFSGYAAYYLFMKKRQVESRQRLIDSFDETIRTIKQYDGHFYLLINILDIEFKKQRIIAREFSNNLICIDRFRFNRAWKNYHQGDDNSPYFKKYITMNNFQNLLLQRINKIINFKHL